MIFTKDDAEGQAVKGCTCGLRAEWGSLDFRMCGYVRRKLAQLLPITCTYHLAIAVVFIYSWNKYIEGAQVCQALSWVQDIVVN